MVNENDHGSRGVGGGECCALSHGFESPFRAREDLSDDAGRVSSSLSLRREGACGNDEALAMGKHCDDEGVEEIQRHGRFCASLWLISKQKRKLA